jgi:ABC-type arginine transport system permease subunit
MGCQLSHETEGLGWDLSIFCTLLASLPLLVVILFIYRVTIKEIDTFNVMQYQNR